AAAESLRRRPGVVLHREAGSTEVVEDVLGGAGVGRAVRGPLGGGDGLDVPAQPLRQGGEVGGSAHRAHSRAMASGLRCRTACSAGPRPASQAVSSDTAAISSDASHGTYTGKE